ncbi:RNA ligase family protein [Paenibacillus sp. PL91]|uniref:ATP-dependent DNA ligase n=1 Tax=Paenibacillus sp. PL91 TaxID=2729538 RepID=UPI00145D1C84|nr:RNA ligase family protein [Paenibacillus sp. PL91]MBC9204998.1 ATP-dependent DNA ligase [Paenibacillus sp. PL91]
MFIEPMLLEKRESPFDDGRYIFEPKIDGHRLILSFIDGQVHLYTRHKTEVTQQYPELHHVPVEPGCHVILDGEVARMDDSGWINFEEVMERFKLTKAVKIRDAALTKPVHYYVFDVLYYNGIDMRNRPLTERKALLLQILTANAFYSPVLSVEGTGIALFDTIKERHLEGIVAKRKNSVYVSRRSDKWMKIINYQYADVHIAGYRKDTFGWLAHVNGRPAGTIELAVPSTHKKAFYGVAKTIVTGEDRNYVYVQPRIKARVRFRNYYKSGLMRSLEFVEFIF